MGLCFILFAEWFSFYLLGLVRSCEIQFVSFNKLYVFALGGSKDIAFLQEILQYSISSTENGSDCNIRLCCRYFAVPLTECFTSSGMDQQFSLSLPSTFIKDIEDQLECNCFKIIHVTRQFTLMLKFAIFDEFKMTVSCNLVTSCICIENHDCG